MIEYNEKLLKLDPNTHNTCEVAWMKCTQISRLPGTGTFKLCKVFVNQFMSGARDALNERMRYDKSINGRIKK